MYFKISNLFFSQFGYLYISKNLQILSQLYHMLLYNLFLKHSSFISDFGNLSSFFFLGQCSYIFINFVDLKEFFLVLFSLLLFYCLFISFSCNSYFLLFFLPAPFEFILLFFFKDYKYKYGG